MKIFLRSLPRAILATSASVILASCSLIAPYDQAAYDKATSTKAEALALMDKAVRSYESQQKEIEQVSLDLDKAYEYDRGRDSNVETVKMWEILRDPNGHLFGGFLSRWKARGTLHTEYIQEKRKAIADGFDQIIALERGKPGSKAQ
jgi:hypothetical protein